MVQQDMQPKRFDAQQVKHARTYMTLAICLGLCGLVWSACTAAAGGGPALFWPLAFCVAPAFCALVAALADFPALYFGWRVQRDFERVCAGVGLSGVGSYLSGWKGIAKYGLLDLSGKGRANGVVIHPKLHNLEGNFEQWTTDIVPLYGQSVDDYSAQAEAFALAFNVRYVSFERGNGVIHLRAGEVMVPAAYEYTPVPELPVARSVLEALPMAQDINDQPFYLPVEGNHVLIAGRTGSGKNSWTWSLVFGLAEARAAGLVRLWGLDPKRVELAFGREWWDEYADSIEGMVELLEKAVHDLLDRNKQLQGKARKLVPSPGMPLNVIIIDELAYLSALVTDKKLRDRAQTAIGTILLLGRATGYSLIACTQDVRKEVIGVRDYFPTKVALGMPAPMVDLCLGDGAWEAGAKCEQIPLREAGAGCAYVLEETSNEPLLVRAAWCSDAAIRMMAANPQAFGLILDEPYPPYEQGLPPQLNFDGTPLDQSDV